MSASPPSADNPAVPPPVRGRRLSRGVRRLLATVFFAAAVALVVVAAHRYLRKETLEPPVATKPLDDPKELTARRRDAIGTYATGTTPGERIIVVGADGGVEFSEIGADPATSRTADTWQLARREKRFCLTTTRSGVIDIINIDTLAYYGDEYRRTK